MWNRKLRKRNLGRGGLVAACALMTSQPALADDVEIYQIEEHQANLLMVLDVSGSMCFSISGNDYGDCNEEVDPELRDASRGKILKNALINIMDNADPGIAMGMSRFGWDGSSSTKGKGKKKKKSPTYDAYGHGIQMPVEPLGENSKDLYEAHVDEFGSFGDSDYQTDIDRTWKESLKAVLDKDFRVRGGTPLVDGLYEAALYWTGEAPDRGKGDENEWDNEHNNDGVNAVAKRGPKAHDMALEGNNGHYKSPAKGDACETNAIVLLTDGQPTVKRDLKGVKKVIHGSNSYSCTGMGYWSGGTNTGECGVDLAAALHEGRPVKNEDYDAKVDTYTIGFALPNDQDAKEYLEAIATAGGGDFYEANSESELVNAFNGILAKISQSNSTFSTGSVSTNGTDQFHHQDAAYLTMFQPALNTTWVGNVKKYRVVDHELVDQNGNAVINPVNGEFYETAKEFWNDGNIPDGNHVAEAGAAGQLDGNRALWVDNTAGSALQTLTGSSLQESDFADLCAFEQYTETKCLAETLSGNVANEQDAIQQLIFGEEEGELNLDFDTLVDYTQGEEEDGAPRKFIGDPLHTLQVAVNYPNDKQLLLFNTNEGYLHAVDTSNGEEQWAFIPRALLPNQVTYYRNQGYVREQKLRDPLENPDEVNATYAEHIYGLDGRMQIWHNDKDHDRVVDLDETALLIIGMRRGGRNYYVLDISNPATPELAFTIEGGTGTGDRDFTELGYTWSQPAIYTVMDAGEEKHVMVIGGGYDEIEDNDGENLANANRLTNTGSSRIGRAIYIVGLEGDDKGKILWKADYASDNRLTSSIPASVSALDTDGDFIADRIYTVDVGGRVWAVQLDQEDIADSTLHLLAELNDGATPEGNRHFYYAPSVTVETSGGETFKAITVGSGYRAHPLDETVQDRIYMLMDDDTVYDDAALKITESDLYDATDNDIGKQSNKSFQSEIFDDGKRGWYFDLAAGEKSLSPTVLFNHKLLFTTYEPTAEEDISTDPNVCTAGSRGNAYVYVIDILDATPVVGLANSNFPADESNRRTQMTLHDIPDQPVVMIGDSGPELLAGRDVITDKDGESPLEFDSYREESWIDVSH